MSKHPELGNFAPDNAERDAVHVAIVPVICGDSKLKRGAYVAIKDGVAYPTDRSSAIGIVDPFLENVWKGMRIFVVLFPGSVIGLRHHYYHPLLDETDNKSLAEAKIRHWANKERIDYDELMESADHYLRTGDYWIEGGRFEGTYLPEDFWDDYDRIRGTQTEPNRRNSFFSCSC